MALILKDTCTGIDCLITKIQNKLNDGLSWTNWENNNRAYVNEIIKDKQNVLVPEIYDSKKEYREAYYNDGFSAINFFILESGYSHNNGFNNGILQAYFQVNLGKLYPAITHRADNEARTEVVKILNAVRGVENISVITGIRNVYSGFYLPQIKYTDLQDYHVFRVDMDVIYNDC